MAIVSSNANNWGAFPRGAPSGTNFICLRPQWMAHMHGIMSRVGNAGAWPSTGFLGLTFGLALANHFGARVSVYGFGACPACNKYHDCDASNSSLDAHNFEPERLGVDSYHPFACEAAVRREWAARGLLSLHEPACDHLPPLQPRPAPTAAQKALGTLRDTATVMRRSVVGTAF